MRRTSESLRFISASAVALALLLAGCSHAPETQGGDAGRINPCPAGLTPDSSDAGCVELAPSGDCPPGTMPQLGLTTCQPVGWTSCPTGFAKASSGWGCEPVVASGPCTGTTREVLGAETCEPVGDCDAPFPPADATIFVDASYGNAQLDRTHYRSLFAAVQAAPANAVVAVAPGTYVEDVDAVQPIHIVGRCAEQVIVENPGDNRAGVLVTSPGVVIQGLTLTGHYSGVYVHQGGEATVSGCVLSANRGAGAYALDQGSSLRVEDSLIEDNVAVGTDDGWGLGAQQGGHLEVVNSQILRNPRYGIAIANPGSSGSIESCIVEDNSGPGLAVADGATAQAGSSLFRRNVAANVTVFYAGSQLELHQSALLQALDDGSGSQGHGITVSSEATVSASECLVAESAYDEIAVSTGATGTFDQMVLRGPIPAPAVPFGLGLEVAAGSTVSLSSSAVVASYSAGLNVEDTGTSLVVTGSLVRDTAGGVAGDPNLNVGRPGIGFGASALAGGHLELHQTSLISNRGVAAEITNADGGTSDLVADGLLVAGTQPDPSNTLQRAIDVTRGAHLELQRSALVGNGDVALLVGLGSSSAHVVDTAIHGASGLRAQDGSITFGDGVVVDSTDGGLQLEGVSIVDCAGVGLVASSAPATIARSSFIRDQVALNVQDGVELSQVESVASAPVAGQLQVDGRSLFVDDPTRTGTGDVPLPPIP